MPGRSARRKGYEGEREWAQELRDMGLKAVRVPLSGAAEGFPGDVISDVPYLGPIAWSVKRRKSFPDWLTKNLPAAVRSDRQEWIVILPLDMFRELVISLLEQSGNL